LTAAPGVSATVSTTCRRPKLSVVAPAPRFAHLSAIRWHDAAEAINGRGGIDRSPCRRRGTRMRSQSINAGKPVGEDRSCGLASAGRAPPGSPPRLGIACGQRLVEHQAFFGGGGVLGGRAKQGRGRLARRLGAGRRKSLMPSRDQPSRSLAAGSGMSRGCWRRCRTSSWRGSPRVAQPGCYHRTVTVERKVYLVHNRDSAKRICANDSERKVMAAQRDAPRSGFEKRSNRARSTTCRRLTGRHSPSRSPASCPERSGPGHATVSRVAG